MKRLPQPWTAAMEATVFTGWIYEWAVIQHQRLRGIGFAIALSIIAAAWYHDRPGIMVLCFAGTP